MKKQKLLVTAATICLTIAAVTGCGKSAKTIDANALATSLTNDIAYTESLEQVSEDAISNYVELEEGVEAVMYMSSGSTAEEVAVFTAKDEDAAKTMQSNVETFLADQKGSFKDYIPEEAARIDEAVVEQNGNYVVLCVSGDSDKAKEIIEEAFK